MNVDQNLRLEAQLKYIIANAGKKWKNVILNPSAKMIKKYPYIKNVQKYIFQNTEKLNNTDFEYTLATRIVWIINHYVDFPKCCVCNQPIVHWNAQSTTDQYKKTCCKKCERKLAQKKIIETMQVKYNVSNAFQLKTVIDQTHKERLLRENKKKATRLARYGDKNFNNTKKATQTKILKYGSVWNLSKRKETLKKKYGNENWNNREKSAITKHINHTFNTSIEEKFVYCILKKYKFPDVIQQFSSVKYPFQCDFYIPAIDTYIEYMGSWTHGKHHYDAYSQKDQETLAIWKQRDGSYYKNAIETWTKRDPLKRKIAQENNLNYIEIWNIDDALSLVGVKDFFAGCSRRERHEKIKAFIGENL